MQQYPDMDAGGGVADPLCGSQSYDGHKGTDLRILSMKDMEEGYAVIAVADGKVLRIRDGEADHLVETEEDRTKIAGKECGNGLVMQMENGYGVQYCHLRKGSLTVQPEQDVRKGDRLGEIGSSGLAQFPHVHITVSRNGEPLDPLTGRKLSEGCTSAFPQEASLFSRDIVEKLDLTKPEILASGLAGTPIDHQALVEEGPPPQVSSSDELFVAWAWFANLKKGNTIKLILKDARGNTLIDHTSEPLDRDKATFSAFAGRKRTLPPGRYEIDVSVKQGDTIARSASLVAIVQ
ncbi:M23 family metallopeptidase [Shinella sp. S4-D37]|uniref:M23 family metallopeptidase n=1 Tax=Shinella sp. S4-D37 TaxID=3161999 RepID=UPI0034677C79